MALSLSGFNADWMNSGNNLSKRIIEPFPKIICILISIVLWVLFLILGIMGIYMRQVSKINTTAFTTKMSFGCMILAGVILTIQFPILIAYLANLKWCQTVSKQQDCRKM